MRRLLFNAVIVGAGWVGLTPAIAISLGLPGLNSLIIATPIEKVGYWKHLYRRYGYPPVPYPYYPPADGYYSPPAAYAYPPPVYGYQPPSSAYGYSPPVYGNQAPPPPAASGNYPSAEETTATIHPQMGTIHRRTASTVALRRMALSALS